MKHFILIFWGLVNFTIVYSQQTDTSKIYGRWVLNSKDPNLNILVHGQDTLEYIPFNSNLTNKLHPALKHAGIRFEENGSFYMHVWNKCGTGNPPDFYEGIGALLEDKNESVITIKLDNQMKKFIIYYLSKDKLVLVDRK
jgi:hypothetical protein